MANSGVFLLLNILLHGCGQSAILALSASHSAGSFGQSFGQRMDNEVDKKRTWDGTAPETITSLLRQLRRHDKNEPEVSGEGAQAQLETEKELGDVTHPYGPFQKGCKALTCPKKVS